MRQDVGTRDMSSSKPEVRFWAEVKELPERYRIVPMLHRLDFFFPNEFQRGYCIWPSAERNGHELGFTPLNPELYELEVLPRLFIGAEFHLRQAMLPHAICRVTEICV